MLSSYTTAELYRLARGYRAKDKHAPIASMHTGRCGHRVRGSFPACLACIEAEIVRRARDTHNQPTGDTQ